MDIDEIMDRFPLIFQQSVGKIPGVKCSLQLRQKAKPVFIKPRDIPFAIRDAVEAELQDLEKDGIITPVEKSDWGSPLVPVPKPDGKIRLCVDYKVAVNPQLTESHYPIPRIEEIISKLRNSTYYCKIDLFKAYLHVEMDEESSKIQTISTHKGTYRMNRLSFGIKTAPGQFHRILDQILCGLIGVVAYFDDIVIHGATRQDCQRNLLACLQRLQDNNLHVNRSKCKFFQTKIAYLGYIVEGNKIRKDPRKVKAILDAPRPRNATETKQFLGLVTYYSRFIPNTSSITFPIRQLISKCAEFRWTAECEAAFLKLKNRIVSEQTLTAYDPELPVTVACDASPTGIGAVLSHIIDGVEHPVAFISRSLTQAERNYSQIDREALAIVFALDKFYIYLYGRKFTLITDNRPLTRIFHQHAKLPPMTASRLLRYAAYLSTFDYEVQHRKNECHVNVDYLSRFPVPYEQPSGNQALLDSEVTMCQEQAINQIATSGVTSADIARHTAEDRELSQLLEKLREGKEDCLDYTISDNIIFKGNRVYIPQCLRPSVLKELHNTHIGMTKMKQLARRYCYWPSINADIEKLVRSCEVCVMSQKSPAKVPLHHWDEPEQNFDRIHIDYAGPYSGFHFLILVDAKSKWPEVRVLNKSPTSSSTIALLRDIFSQHGFLQIMVSDNATIFKSDEFKDYCVTHGIFQTFTAPGHPATNGLAERYVQILKAKLRRMEEEPGSMIHKIQKILLQFRATPLACGQSPAELYLNRSIRIRLDAIRPFKPKANVPAAISVRQFKIGQRVSARVYTDNKPIWKLGVIKQKFGNLHYEVRLDTGYTLKRHIDQLRAVDVPFQPNFPESVKKKVSFSAPPSLVMYDTINPRRVVHEGEADQQDQPRLMPQPVQAPNHEDPTLPARPVRRRQAPRKFEDYVRY